MPETPEMDWKAVRNARLYAAGFQTYEEYIDSAQWSRVRMRYRNSSRPQNCILCDEAEVVLHHRTYENLGGEGEIEDLVPLCLSHHADVHELERRGQIGLGDVETLHSAVMALKYEPEVVSRKEMFSEFDAMKMETRARVRQRQVRQRLHDALRVALQTQDEDFINQQFDLIDKASDDFKRNAKHHLRTLKSAA